MIRISINVPPELLARLRQQHADTYPQHRLAFAAWLRQIWIEYGFRG